MFTLAEAERGRVGLYDRYLGFRVRRHDAAPPRHVALVLAERDLLEPGAYDTLEQFFDLAVEYGTERVTVYVSVLDEAVAPTLERALGDVDAPKAIAIRGPTDRTQADAPIQVSIGLGGKHEFTAAVRALARKVEDGDSEPEAVTEADIEERLVFPDPPDLVVRTGAERLSDFMIWQSVYSELYFTDVNWRDFRRRDYLRALREYKQRSRRFGR